MPATFNHSADDLFSFFSQPGRGFYVPYYQRNYSWDDENATKLINDIFAAIERTLTKPKNTVFLGTVILHDEKNVQVGTHVDTRNLLSKVSNVVDGQQRITSISLLGCVLYEILGQVASDLRAEANGVAEMAGLATELKDAQRQLLEFFSIDIPKSDSQPQRKPLIIRAGDISSNPVSDQWTLNGNVSNFYRSDPAMFQAEVINGGLTQNITVNDRIRSVIDIFTSTIRSELDDVTPVFAQSLLQACDIDGCTIQDFIAYPPSFTDILALGQKEQAFYFSGLMLLAVSAFLKKGCHLVVIECLDEDLAFDMFQALNATGTPLTAFEVFKPAIVKAWGASYATSIKTQVDRVEQVFDQESTANGKEEITDRVIGATALVYNGISLSQRFSDERNWLMSNIPASGAPLDASLVTCLADQAEYYNKFIRPRRSPRGSTSFGLVQHLQGLGLTINDADLAALCIFYLRDAQHAMAHAVLSVFYARLLRAQSSHSTIPSAAQDFLSICKATAAFFTLWMGASPGRFPDSDYRKMFDQSVTNISVASGSSNQTVNFVKSAFRSALAAQGTYDAANSVIAKSLWVGRAKQTSWYQRKAVCRFGLFAAFNDAVPDTTTGNEGFFVSGLPGTSRFLTSAAWHSTDYEVIEHIATRDKPTSIKFPLSLDNSIYPGNYSVVDKIGNLTLLSNPINASIYSEWPDKTFYYWSLTMPSSTVAGPTGNALMNALGITALPPSLSSLQAASNYLPHLAPLAVRGIAGLAWDSAFIDQRSDHLCNRIFDKLDNWLR